MSNEVDFNAEMERLGLIDDGDEAIDTNNLPKERPAVSRDLPQPGTLKLRLPGNISDSIKPVQVPGLGQRIQLALRDDCALTDVKSGMPLNYNVSAAEMAVYKSGAVVGYKSELAYLLKGVGYEGALSSKADQLRAIHSAAGKEFKADVSWTATCNPNRPIYRDKAKQEQPGCGQKYRLTAESYTKKDGTKVNILAIPRDVNGVYQQRFTCANPECRAELQAFLQLSNYRKA